MSELALFDDRERYGVQEKKIETNPVPKNQLIRIISPENANISNYWESFRIKFPSVCCANNLNMENALNSE